MTTGNFEKRSAADKATRKFLEIWGRAIVPILATFVLISGIVTDNTIWSPAVDAIALVLTIFYGLYFALEIPIFNRTDDQEDA